MIHSSYTIYKNTSVLHIDDCNLYPFHYRQAETKDQGITHNHNMQRTRVKLKRKNYGLKRYSVIFIGKYSYKCDTTMMIFYNYIYGDFRNLYFVVQNYFVLE